MFPKSLNGVQFQFLAVYARIKLNSQKVNLGRILVFLTKAPAQNFFDLATWLSTMFSLCPRADACLTSPSSLRRRISADSCGEYTDLSRCLSWLPASVTILVMGFQWAWCVSKAIITLLVEIFPSNSWKVANPVLIHVIIKKWNFPWCKRLSCFKRAFWGLYSR